MDAMALPVPTNPRTGRLTRVDKERAIDLVYTAMVEQGETQLKRLAEIAGVTRRRIHPLIAAARKRIALETGEEPAAARTKLSGRFEKLYRDALRSYETAKSKGDLKNASEFQRNAIAIVSQHAKVLGIENLPAAAGQQPNVRIIFEDFREAPAAAKAAFARTLQAASGASEVPQLTGEVQSPGMRSAVGQRLRDHDGTSSPGDIPSDGASE